VQHIGGEPVVIPNGVYVDRYATAEARPEWRGDAGTLAFVGRLDEPRKGFPLMLEAFDGIDAQRPGVRLLVVGGGDLDKARSAIAPRLRDQVRLLGRATDAEKAAALRSADIYVAPNTGGESFGIVLVEAMAAGATVLASDLPAFRRVLGDGRYGVLFRTGDAADLVDEAVALLDDPARRKQLDEDAAVAVRRYDWSSVAGRVVQVYETVAGGQAR
jgi:phosphatidyl-myo-inositol alpha-mannosyltransferase